MQTHYPQPAASLHASATAGLDPADLLTPEQAAQTLGLSVKTLATWRSTGRHALAFVRCGARIRYRRADLLAWLERRTCTSNAVG
ncbi:DNA-binding protein [Pseudomonas sp. o96-267]|uniref:helix-turn-helix domain-containing protein n=1 Tax=Pseudomonas sp. o96-267 TaxID=2479853 RepID=UPI000F7A4255|nr:helix-turn-helix domain-containing protein [Pseudomonas sp. o96-267]RRV39824.1 DNA-binding protein [Pseudomonas sp. o96-267]